MSAYSPTLPRTTDLRGADRLLVLVGSALTDLGRRRAAARARTIGTRRSVDTVLDAGLDAGRAGPRATGTTAALEAASERTRDRAAMSRMSVLP